MTIVPFPLPKRRVPTMDEWNKIAEAFHDTRPVEGLNIMINDAAQGGAQINATGGGIGGGGMLTPLKVIRFDGGNVRIVYGTVGGRSDPFSPGDSPVYKLAASAGDKIIAGLTQEYDEISSTWTTTALYFISQSSVPDGDATNAYIEIGSVGENLATASATSGSIGHNRCGDGTDFFDRFWLV